MNILLICIVVAVCGYCLRRKRPIPLPGPILFSPRRHRALKLAEPILVATSISGFFEADVGALTDEGRAYLRAPLLHQIGLRNDASDEQAREHFETMLERQWYRLDLDKLNATDDPRAAMGFACVRVAFLVRCALLQGWVERDPAWRVLLLNAQRAQECFDSWEDFGQAYLAGRQQWVAAFRADGLGGRFDQADLDGLLKPPSGGWAELPWNALPALDPVAP